MEIVVVIMIVEDLEGGRPAIKHYAEGHFDNAPVTEWVRGQPAEVYWRVTAEHRGHSEELGVLGLKK